EAAARRQRFEERERDAVQQSQVPLAALDVGRQDAFKSERAAKEAARQRDEARRTLEDREKSLAEARKQRNLESALRASAEEDAKRAEEAKLEAVRRRAEAVRPLIRLHVANGARLQDSGDLSEAVLWFTGALRL